VGGSFAFDINPGVFTGSQTTGLEISVLGSMAHTRFWVDRREEFIGIFMIQVLPESPLPYRDLFRPVVYGAIID